MMLQRALVSATLCLPLAFLCSCGGPSAATPEEAFAFFVRALEMNNPGQAKSLVSKISWDDFDEFAGLLGDSASINGLEIKKSQNKGRSREAFIEVVYKSGDRASFWLEVEKDKDAWLVRRIKFFQGDWKTLQIQQELKHIDDAFQEYYIEHNVDAGGAVPSIQELVDLGYLRELPTPPMGGAYQPPTSVPAPGDGGNSETYPSWPGGTPENGAMHPQLLAAIEHEESSETK